MEALFIVLNDLSYLEPILNRFIDMKVRGATILDSMGMARAIMNSEGMNFISSGPFQRSLDNDQKQSKTIFTVIPEGQDAKVIVDEVKKIVSTSKREVIGFMFTMPVSGIYPMKPKKL
jgi:hypothetical protein